MLIKQDFYYGPAQANRRLHIRIPDNLTEPCPVMYYFDGHNLFLDRDATYGKSWGLEEYLSGWDKKIIVVGVECTHEGDRRLSEYNPYYMNNGWLGGKDAWGDATMQWLLYEVKPWVDAHFPTIPFRECTGIAGSSMGGLMATYAVVRHNDLISKAACLSPAIGFCSGKLWHDMNTTPMNPDTRVYLSWGTQEARGVKDVWQEDRSSSTYRTIRATANKVLACGGAAMMYCQVGGRHCEEDWEKQNGIYLPFLWQA